MRLDYGRINVKVGWYIIEHDATGKVFVGTSKDVSGDIDKHVKKLVDGKHPIVNFQKAFQLDDRLRFQETPTKTLKEAKRAASEYLSTVAHDYLVLNQ